MARVTPETKRQGERIQALRVALGVSKPLMASRLGFESTQSLELYERGISVIRLDQLHLWAEAFEMAEVDFVNAVFNARPVDADWTFRSALRGRIPESLIERYAPRWEPRPLIDQQAAVEAILEMAAEIRDESGPPSRSHAV